MAVWFIWMTALSTNVLNWMSSVKLKFSQFGHQRARLVYKTCLIISARQRSRRKVMFSVMSVILFRGWGPLCTGPWFWPPLSKAPPPPPPHDVSKQFNFDLTVQGPWTCSNLITMKHGLLEADGWYLTELLSCCKSLRNNFSEYFE